MSDHESEKSPTGTQADSEPGGSFSTNGSDPAANAFEAEGGSGDGSSFLSELARAMQTTAAAEQARNAEGTEQRRQAHIDSIRAREAIEAEELRELAKEDVKGIDDWSDGEIKRIKLERERRIASRREQLQIRLEDHRTVIAREVEAVEAAVGAYRADIEQYFRRLESETDPVAIAKQAGSRPPFPVLELIGPDDVPVTSEFRHVLSEAPPRVEPVSTDEGTPGDNDDSGAGAATDSPLIGVMDPEVVAEPTEAARDAGSEPVATEPVAAEAVVAEAPAAEAVAEEAAPTEPVPAEAVAAQPSEDAVPSNEGAEASAAGEGSEEEPVGAAAEAMVVMPRSTGAGSWLRWPNGSPDRSDPGN